MSPGLLHSGPAMPGHLLTGRAAVHPSAASCPVAERTAAGGCPCRRSSQHTLVCRCSVRAPLLLMHPCAGK